MNTAPVKVPAILSCADIAAARRPKMSMTQAHAVVKRSAQNQKGVMPPSASRITTLVAPQMNETRSTARSPRIINFLFESIPHTPDAEVSIDYFSTIKSAAPAVCGEKD